MSAYYNEIDPFAAAWLRSLISAGHLPLGDVDERSIEDVAPDELTAYRQIHFFAGIGGWAYALRLAGWPDDRPVVTGSAPCQPYSSAGKGAGFDDERHLWPAMFWHVQQRQPATVIGEQVSSKAALEWWDLVASDLEGEGYATASADLPASSVGAPHRRQRLFWVAHAQSKQRRERESFSAPQQKESVRRDRSDGASQRCAARHLANAQSKQRQRSRAPRAGRDGFADSCNPWANAQWIDCLDNKQRPIEPSIRLLAHGVPNRVGRLRGYGNAIVPQLAAVFVRSFLEIQ